MAEIKRSTLFGKLNPIGYKSIEAATIFCKMRGNPYVETVHWLHQLLQQQDSDVLRIIRHFGLDASRLATDLIATLDRLPRGATAISDFSPQIETALQQAYVYGTLLFGEYQVRTGFLLVAFAKTDSLRNSFIALSSEFSKIKGEQLTDDFAKIVAGSPEDGMRASDGSGMSAGAAPGEASGAMAPAEMGKQEALKRFTTDLTEKARKGEIDPVIGRDEEIRQCVDILMRRRQNNPILTGEAGVGKTAVVEGFAHRIIAGDVPPALKDVTLRSLDVGLLTAGASMKGEFEQRLRGVIDEIQASPKPIILFIDEVHTLMGAGGSGGAADAANLLKPALARGTLRTVAATTWDEYKRHIEKDPALTRRFQTVKIEEPDEARCIRMMRAVMAPFEKHHKVQVLDEAIDSAVKLSHRYIAGRQLPDKAVSLIDTAAARVAVSQHAIPAEVDDCRRRIQALDTELEILGRETATGLDHTTRVAEIQENLGREKDNLGGLEKHWGEEKELVTQILDIRSKLRAGGIGPDDALKAATEAAPAAATAATAAKSKPADPQSPAPAPASGNGHLTPAERDKLLSELKALQGKLKEFQGESPLIFPSVDANAIASVVADWTGIPVGKMVKNEIEQVLHLADTLEKRVIGQRHALEMIARRVQTSRARLDNPNRPIGVFMLVGPSGTGKTETALTLSEALYGGEQNMISINMSEFQEAHTVSTLKGSPPGYVGYGEGGILTEAVRRRPYSVVLLDEVEKAHSDVHEIFFQVFDKGWMEDAEGRYIDFKNTIIILTSNAAQDVIINMCKDPELMPDAEGLEKAMRTPLTKVFPDALLNRLMVVPYYPISKEVLQLIIKLNLSKVGKRVKENHKVPFTYDETVPELIGQRCTELERGARMVDAMITNTMLPEIGREFLTRLAAGNEIKRVHVTAKDGNFAFS
ncbi:MAG TPA: type VI secretion system ATPase TssH, partial [Candidatus Dormibacteraeota bacterium]|nr:type VI secretion system ATPase TssH [Candidatus Dormibacteraeota bacterium]